MDYEEKELLDDDDTKTLADSTGFSGSWSESFRYDDEEYHDPDDDYASDSYIPKKENAAKKEYDSEDDFERSGNEKSGDNSEDGITTYDESVVRLRQSWNDSNKKHFSFESCPEKEEEEKSEDVQSQEDFLTRIKRMKEIKKSHKSRKREREKNYEKTFIKEYLEGASEKKLKGIVTLIGVDSNIPGFFICTPQHICLSLLPINMFVRLPFPPKTIRYPIKKFLLIYVHLFTWITKVVQEDVMGEHETANNKLLCEATPSYGTQRVERMGRIFCAVTVSRILEEKKMVRPDYIQRLEKNIYEKRNFSVQMFNSVTQRAKDFHK